MKYQKAMNLFVTLYTIFLFETAMHFINYFFFNPCFGWRVNHEMIILTLQKIMK